MAGAGFRTFIAGETLTAARVNTYLMQQSVATFASESARSYALSSPSDGQVSYITEKDNFQVWDGSSWVTIGSNGAWTSYTPTLGNITLGNGTLSFAYSQIGQTVNVRGRVTFGSTTSISGIATFSLPVTPLSFGYGAANIVAASLNYGAVSVITGTSVVVWAYNSAGTYLARANTSATVPNTFTTADTISFSLTYEAA
jgi:hypothetical protein